MKAKKPIGRMPKIEMVINGRAIEFCCGISGHIFEPGSFAFVIKNGPKKGRLVMDSIAQKIGFTMTAETLQYLEKGFCLMRAFSDEETNFPPTSNE